MKKLVSFVMLCSILVCSCQKDPAQKDSERLPGKWDPIELSQSEIVFGADGGSCSIESKNYSAWWLNGIEVTGTKIYYQADPGENYSYLTASGEGIDAKVGSKKNTVEITVASSSQKHEWKVWMTVGDAFTSILVKQN